MQDIETVAEICRHELDTKSGRANRFFWFYAPLMIAFYLAGNYVPSNRYDFFMATMLVVLILMATALGVNIRNNAYSHATEFVAVIESKCIRHIDILLRVLFPGTLFQSARPLRIQARDALPEILDSVTQDNAAELNESLRAYLRSTLLVLCTHKLRENDEKLALSIIGALERVHDGKCVEEIRKCANTARNPRLREMARASLDRFIEFQSRQEQQPVLLRPVEERNISTESLLRSAQSTPEEASDQLLRPHNTKKNL